MVVDVDSAAGAPKLNERPEGFAVGAAVDVVVVVVVGLAVGRFITIVSLPLEGVLVGSEGDVVSFVAVAVVAVVVVAGKNGVANGFVIGAAGVDDTGVVVVPKEKPLPPAGANGFVLPKEVDGAAKEADDANEFANKPKDVVVGGDVVASLSAPTPGVVVVEEERGKEAPKVPNEEDAPPNGFAVAAPNGLGVDVPNEEDPMVEPNVVIGAVELPKAGFGSIFFSCSSSL